MQAPTFVADYNLANPFTFVFPSALRARLLRAYVLCAALLTPLAALAQDPGALKPANPRKEAKVERKAAKAQDQSAELTAKDPRAEAVLSKARIKMNGANDLTAKFKYQLENKAAKQKAVIKNGAIKFKGQKYRVDFDDQLLLCDGKTVWNYLKVEKEVNVTNYDPNEGFNMDRIFRIYNDDMKARYDRADRVLGIATEKITLFPSSSRTDYFRVELWLSAKDGIPVRLRVWGRNGSTVTYELSDVRLNSNVPDTEFVFNSKAFPGVEIIDLR